MTKCALEDVLGSMQTTTIPAVTERDMKTKEDQEPKSESEPAEKATEKDFNLLDFYSSFSEFEDEGEN